MNPHSARYEPKQGAKEGNLFIVFCGWLKYSLIPGLIFLTESLAYMHWYHHGPRISIAIGVFFILLCLFQGYASYKMNYKKAAFCNFFCAVAIFIGGTVGTSIHLTRLVDYWSFYQRRHYTNVAPDESAAAHSDASVIVFMDGSRPDATRVSTYTRYGSTYCVAPVIIDGDDTPLTDIQYWAVGKNCCDKGFTCGDSNNDKARSGLVLRNHTGMDGIAKGVLSEDEFHFYTEAVTMSLTKFDVTSPKERLFLHFVADIGAAHLKYYTDGLWEWWRAQMLTVPLWMTFGMLTVLMGYDEYKHHIGDVKASFFSKLNSYV